MIDVIFSFILYYYYITMRCVDTGRTQPPIIIKKIKCNIINYYRFGQILSSSIITSHANIPYYIQLVYNSKVI